MGTRAGTVDPGVQQYLCKKLGVGIEDVTSILNKQSGLMGVSGISGDMRVLTDIAFNSHDKEKRERAQLAIDIFVYHLCRHISALTVGLRADVDALVFTGGIGENSTYIRNRVVERLKHMRMHLDPSRNADHGRNSKGFISSEDSPMAVLVIPTNEEIMIGREVVRVLSSGKKSQH
jgi:acetate kinase